MVRRTTRDAAKKTQVLLMFQLHWNWNGILSTIHYSTHKRLDPLCFVIEPQSFHKHLFIQLAKRKPFAAHVSIS